MKWFIMGPKYGQGPSSFLTILWSGGLGRANECYEEANSIKGKLLVGEGRSGRKLNGFGVWKQVL